MEHERAWISGAHMAEYYDISRSTVTRLLREYRKVVRPEDILIEGRSKVYRTLPFEEWRRSRNK